MAERIRELSNAEFTRLSYEDQQSYLRSLFDESENEDEVFDMNDDSEDEWLPAPLDRGNGDSDVEDVREDRTVRIEVDEESDSSDDEHIEENDYNCEISSQDILKAKDGTIWRRKPMQRQTLRHNILRSQESGPHRSTNMLSVVDTFRCIFSNVMSNIVVRETNRKAKETYDEYNKNNPNKPPRQWKILTEEEFNAYLGILINAGVHQSNKEHVKVLWETTSNPLYRASMGLNRFCELNRFLRFDNKNTRQYRLETDKAAAISELFEILNSNLRSNYTPSECIVVDEQLFPFRGRTRFTQYMPSKPAKYGIKVWWVCDASNSYPITGQIYTGKQASGRETNQGERIVRDLCARFKGSGRNIVTDNFFTSLPLARLLMSWNLSIVGTLKKNKPYVPPEMLPSRSRETYSSVFGFSDDNITICSYVPKNNKSVILLSTQHYTENIIGEKQKPEIIHYYNSTKSGVDTMDKLVTHYTTKRKTQRWPVAFFYNIIDVACVAAYKIYTANNPSDKTHKRRIFLRDLALQLALPHINARAAIPNIYRHFNTRSGIECVLGKPLTVTCQVATSSAEEIRDSTGRISQTGKCFICLESDPKKRRATRKSCSTCKKPVCAEHTNSIVRCLKCTN